MPTGWFHPRAALLLLCAAAAFAGCQKPVRVGIPPKLAEDEARRAMRAKDLALKAERAKDPDDAIALYQEAVLEYRETPHAWNNLGVLMMNKQQYLQAAEAFNTAAAISPSDARPLYNMGLLYDNRGYIREARRFYEQSLERDAGYLPALRGVIRADSLLNEGSLQTLKWLERALMIEQNPDWLEWMRLQKARIENLPAIRAQNTF